MNVRPNKEPYVLCRNCLKNATCSSSPGEGMTFISLIFISNCKSSRLSKVQFPTKWRYLADVHTALRAFSHHSTLYELSKTGLAMLLQRAPSFQVRFWASRTPVFNLKAPFALCTWLKNVIAYWSLTPQNSHCIVKVQQCWVQWMLKKMVWSLENGEVRCYDFSLSNLQCLSYLRRLRLSWSYFFYLSRVDDTLNRSHLPARLRR